MTRAKTPDIFVPSYPAASLAAWTAAWRAGMCSPDGLLDTFADLATQHTLVDGDAENDTANPHSTGTAEFLTVLSDAASVELRLPAPGDPQGLPPGTATSGILRAGEALIFSSADGDTAALYPRRRIGHELIWHLASFDDPIAPLTDYAVKSALFDLTEAMRTAADVLSGVPAMSSGSADGLRSELAAATSRRTITLPPHDNPRVDSLLASAARTDAILDVAQSRGASFGLTASQGAGGDQQLAALRAVTRRAVTVGVNSVIRELLRVS